MTAAIDDPRGELIRIGQECHQRGWSLATSSNYSVRTGHDPLTLLITGSGFDKGALSPDDFVELDADGTVMNAVVGDTIARPSAESLLHVEAYAASAGVGAVLHTHSVWSTVLSKRAVDLGQWEVCGYEMQKALSGVDSHETPVRLAIFENRQDIAELADQVADRRHRDPDSLKHGYLIAGHGLYTWGTTLNDARRHLHCLEFLLEVSGRIHD